MNDDNISNFLNGVQTFTLNIKRYKKTWILIPSEDIFF